MRGRELQTNNRRALVWYLLGFFAVQIALGVATDVRWSAIRDPDFDDLRQIVAERQAETPGRPLVLFFGSSRMKADLRAELLNHPENPAAPVVVNAAASGAGPMLHDVFLRRWLDAGIRPDLICLEVIPMSLSAQDGAPIEEEKNSERYCAAEVAHVWPYYAEPAHLCWRWAWARIFPSFNHRAELRDALAIDVRAGGKIERPSGRDDFGWAPGPQAMPPETVQRRTQHDLHGYHTALTQPAVAPGAMQAMRSFLSLSRKERIAVVLIVPPESSAFRSYCPTATASQLNAVRSLADELGVGLLDHSAWVDDDCFWDGHHPTESGGTQYTRRFAKEVFEPLAAGLARSASAGSSDIPRLRLRVGLTRAPLTAGSP